MHVTGWALACSDQSEAVRSDMIKGRRRRKAHGQRELGWGHGGAEERVSSSSEGGERMRWERRRAEGKMESGG
jgi:hypothetical protein